MKSIMSLVKNKQKFKSSKSEYYKLNPKSSPTFSVRPRSSVGRVTVGRGFDSHWGQKIFSLPRVVPCFPLLGLTPCGLFIGLNSTLIYTSELILCFTIIDYQYISKLVCRKTMKIWWTISLTLRLYDSSVNPFNMLITDYFLSDFRFVWCFTRMELKL